MVATCSVKGCKTESYAGSLISLHNLPNDEELKKKWIEVVPFKGKVTKYSRVCGLHFTPLDFSTRPGLPITRKVLKPDAVPTKFNYDDQFKKHYQTLKLLNEYHNNVSSEVKPGTSSVSESSETLSPLMFDTNASDEEVTTSTVATDDLDEAIPAARLMMETSENLHDCKMEIKIEAEDFEQDSDPLATQPQSVSNLVVPTTNPATQPPSCTCHTIKPIVNLQNGTLTPRESNLQIQLQQHRRKMRKLVKTNKHLRDKIKVLQDVLKKVTEKSRHIRKSK